MDRAIKIRGDRSNFESHGETVHDLTDLTMATITTIIRSRTSIPAIMTSGLLRCRTCLPNKTQVVAIPTCLWSNGTRSLPVVNIGRRTREKVLLDGHTIPLSLCIDHGKKKNIRHLVTRSNILFYINYLLPIIDRTRSIMLISVFTISHFRFISKIE